MPDVTPVRYARLELPYQQFTRNDEFKSCAGGYVYIGKPENDPTWPSNQIMVYAKEGDTYTPIPQPVSINYGGFMVWNGQPVLLTVREAYSIAVYAADGTREFYCSSYTPDLLQAEEDTEIDLGALMSQDVMSMPNMKRLKTPESGSVPGDYINEIPSGIGGLWYCAPFQTTPVSMGFPSESSSPGVLMVLTGGAFATQLYFTSSLSLSPPQMYIRSGTTYNDGTNNEWSAWVQVV